MFCLTYLSVYKYGQTSKSIDIKNPPPKKKIGEQLLPKDVQICS